MSDETKVYSIDLDKLADSLGKVAGHKMTREEAWAKGACVSCGKEAIPKCYSSAGVKEYRLSGLCEVDHHPHLILARKSLPCLLEGQCKWSGRGVGVGADNGSSSNA